MTQLPSRPAQSGLQVLCLAGFMGSGKTTVGTLLARQLEKIVREREGYEQAKRRALAILKKGFDLGYPPPASRDELHER